VIRTATSVVIAGLALWSAHGFAGASPEETRYRGDYTYGHEVNIFCPDINSQCYWLSGDTPGEVRESLQRLASGESAAPYTPVCVLVEGVVDRHTARSGFAADYDGLIKVSKLLGTCAESTLVIESDLQHHRWVLESIDGEVLRTEDTDGLVPELDFGEQMQVTGNTGCNRISGKAELRGEYFRIPALASTRRFCSPPQNDLERTLQDILTRETRITLDEEKNLLLATDETVLRFRSQDWVK
jgi:heat shock protein HslJ